MLRWVLIMLLLVGCASAGDWEVDTSESGTGTAVLYADHSGASSGRVWIVLACTSTGAGLPFSFIVWSGSAILSEPVRAEFAWDGASPEVYTWLNPAMERGVSPLGLDASIDFLVGLRDSETLDVVLHSNGVETVWAEFDTRDGDKILETLYRQCS